MFQFLNIIIKTNWASGKSGWLIYYATYRDNTTAFLDGGKTYKLTVSTPVPGNLFWSATVYDVDTRSMIATDQDKVVVGSLKTNFQTNPDGSIDIYFGPLAPLQARKTSGLRQFLTKASSSTYASTAQKRQRSTEHGNSIT